MKVRIKFEPRDCWVGVFWNHFVAHRDIETRADGSIYGRWWWETRVYICILPCLPIVITIPHRLPSAKEAGK